MSDESIPEKSESTEDATPTVGAGELQDVRKVRNWRQRYAGPNGEYVYRRRINVRGPGGKLRRVEAGERVDAKRDGITDRRLKALWFSESIELADKFAIRQRPLKKGIVNNLAIRQAEERERKAEDAKLEAKRLRRREINSLRIAAEEQRRLAEQAILAAEQRERQEIEDLIEAEENAKREAKIQDLLEKRTATEAEEVTIEKELADEQAQVEAEKAQLARVRHEDAERKAGEEQVRLERATMQRIEARAADEQSRQAPPSPEGDAPLDNTKVTLSADEAKAALKEGYEG